MLYKYFDPTVSFVAWFELHAKSIYPCLHLDFLLEYTYAVKLDLPSGPVGRLPADVDEVHAGDVVVSALDRGLRRRPRESVFGGA